MAQSGITSFQNATAVTARKLEVTAADFDGGVNNAASNAPGIGIAVGQANAAGTDEQFTLLDQAGAVRVPQDSAHIGVTGLGGTLPSSGGASGPGVVPIDTVTNDAGAVGEVTKTGTANLQTLAAGWVDTAV